MKGVSRFISLLFIVLAIISFLGLYISITNLDYFNSVMENIPEEFAEIFLTLKPNWWEYVLAIVELILFTCLAIFFMEFADEYEKLENEVFSLKNQETEKANKSVSENKTV